MVTMPIQEVLRSSPRYRQIVMAQHHGHVRRICDQSNAL